VNEQIELNKPKSKRKTPAQEAVDQIHDEKQKTAAQWEAIRNFINHRCIHRVPPASKEIISLDSPSQHYEWQFYLREVSLEPAALGFTAEQFWKLHALHFKEKPFQIACVEQAGTYLLTAILIGGAARGIPIHAFSVRKDCKAYGIGNIIEGRPDYRLPVMFIDDLTSPTHNTFWHFVRVLKRFKLTIYPWAFVLVRKQRRNDPREISTSFGNVMIESLYCLDDFNMTLDDYQRHSSEKAKTQNGGG
jgi:orotate phosphoribosyltransferase